MRKFVMMVLMGMMFCLTSTTTHVFDLGIRLWGNCYQGVQMVLPEENNKIEIMGRYESFLQQCRGDTTTEDHLRQAKMELISYFQHGGKLSFPDWN